jgi:hypothetical protein
MTCCHGDTRRAHVCCTAPPFTVGRVVGDVGFAALQLKGGDEMVLARLRI